MALSTQPYKGARDFYPEDKRLQKYIFRTWREVAEKFGYEEYDAPILEPLDIYAAKTGEEIVNDQTYAFTDRGGREVVIRPEMTPTVSRMVAAKRQELAYPLRWYSIPNLWRYERPQKGRLREHWQLNVDLFGVEGTEAEHEVILMADKLMKAFRAKQNMYTIKINSRQLMDVIFHDYLGLDKTQAHSITKLIDRMHKIEQTEFAGQAEALLHPSQRDQGASQKLFSILEADDLSDLPGELKNQPAYLKLAELLERAKKSYIPNAVFDPTIMRGFDYYTDIVFEVFDNDPANNRSMFGGGRYDGLVGLFGAEPIPTVGFGMGDVTILNFLESHKLLPAPRPETELYMILIGDLYDEVQPVVDELRDIGVKVAIDMSGRKADKQIKTALKKGIRHVLFVGDKELASDKYMLKDLVSGEEEAHSLHRVASIVKDRRKNS